MNKAVKILFPIWTIVLIFFFFIPLGGYTGFEAVLIDGSILPWLGLGAGVACWVGLLIINIKNGIKK
jgi:hypothetical protein